MNGQGSLRKEMLTFEPLRMVNVKQEAEEEQGLKTLELSNLDHLYDYYNTVALFYDGQDVAGSVASNGHLSQDGMDVVDLATKLQNALEELIAHYPAAAGRVYFNETTKRYEVLYKSESPSCRGADTADSMPYGVPFIVARADTTLAMLGDVTALHPCFDILYPDVPKRNPKDRLSPPLVFIQVTTFTCGSFSLALASSHMLTDGYSAAVFMKNLCSIAKGAGLAFSMDLTNRREIFKPRVPLSPNVSMHPHILAKERAGETSSPPTKLPYGDATRFSISPAALESLRLRASLKAEGRKCSRYQALLALLWMIRAKCCVHSGALPSQELPLRVPINLRGRELLASTGEYMGNAVEQCIVRATLQELCESSLACVVQKIMSSMVRGVQVQEHVQSGIDYIETFLQNGCLPYVDHALLAIPTLVNLPFYDADCGWGRPFYCGRPSRQLGERMIVLEDPRSKCWNVLVVLNSQEEHNIFQEMITVTCQ